MKPTIILLTILFFVGNIFAQEIDKPLFEQPHKKFEQLEQLKLLEILNLEENTAIKFITRRNKNRDKVFEIMKEFDSELDKMEKILHNEKKEKNYSEFIDKCITFEIKITEEKNNFVKSLDDILTDEQIAKVILFDRKFKKDVRDILLDKGRKRISKEREN
ncbi:MAG: hypothetical protein IPH62_01420 [Ignavibacteriae bacterium]|nr:hypothetical protein [Ignavibacteriota bacterium]